MQEEALRIGREIARYLERLFAERKAVQIVGPKALPCKMKEEEISNYLHDELDIPLKGEPHGYEPTVRAWIFKTDC
jgi:hypothetical protein